MSLRRLVAVLCLSLAAAGCTSDGPPAPPPPPEPGDATAFLALAERGTQARVRVQFEQSGALEDRTIVLAQDPPLRALHIRDAGGGTTSTYVRADGSLAICGDPARQTPCVEASRGQLAEHAFDGPLVAALREQTDPAAVPGFILEEPRTIAGRPATCAALRRPREAELRQCLDDETGVTLFSGVAGSSGATSDRDAGMEAVSFGEPSPGELEPDRPVSEPTQKPPGHP